MSESSVAQPTLNNRALKALLKRLGACSEARDWVGNRDAETAWRECERGDHMLWLVARMQVERTLIVKAAALCAQTALVYVPDGEDRPRLCVEAVLRWAEAPTEENLEAVREARRNAADAAAATYATYAATYATYAATYAAAAATYAAYAAADATYATYAATYAAAAATYAAADAADATAATAATRKKALARCADIVRETIPFSVVLDASRPPAAGEPR